jgi:hypothetical protein
MVKTEVWFRESHHLPLPPSGSPFGVDTGAPRGGHREGAGYASWCARDIEP